MSTILRTSIRTAAAVACATAAIAGLTVSAAAADIDARRITVRYDDLDTTRSAGAATLYHRIQLAAQEVCGQPGRRDLRVIAEHRACAERAVDAAVRDVHVAALTALRFGTDIRLASK